MQAWIELKFCIHKHHLVQNCRQEENQRGLAEETTNSETGNGVRTHHFALVVAFTNEFAVIFAIVSHLCNRMPEQN